MILFSLRDLSASLRATQNNVRRYALAQGWEQVESPVGVSYEISEAQLEEARNAFNLSRAASAVPQEKRLRLIDLQPGSHTLWKTNCRKEAVDRVQILCAGGAKKMEALKQVVLEFAVKYPRLTIGGWRTVHRWCEKFAAGGIDALIDQCRACSGRKAVEVSPEWKKKLRAAVADRDGKIAPAVRALAKDPELPASLRQHMHEAHSRKSYVTPAIQKAATVSPAELRGLQGSRHAAIKGRFTPSHIVTSRANWWWQSDDMTDNNYTWIEDPASPIGWRVLQAQFLPWIDCVTQLILSVTVVSRPSGAYTADDIWSSLGRTFDAFGIPQKGLRLEGGTWNNNLINGQRTGIDNAQREGALQSLGLEVIRAWNPNQKVIESIFNRFQTMADVCIGHAGRDQRRQLPQHIKEQLQLCRSGKVHPREYFQHLSARLAQLQKVADAYNNERQEGLLRGLSPRELWLEHGPAKNAIPDDARWIYAQAMNISRITRNGVRAQVGSGGSKQTHYWDNPEKLPLLEGQRVKLYWHLDDPQAPCCVHAIDGRFICEAAALEITDRYDGRRPASEVARIKAAKAVVHRETRVLAENMQRRQTPIVADVATAGTGQRILKQRLERKQEEKIKRKISRSAQPQAAAETMADFSATRAHEKIEHTTHNGPGLGDFS
jgi:hypothetical protein